MGCEPMCHHERATEWEALAERIRASDSDRDADAEEPTHPEEAPPARVADD